jgi:hypothetical protein
MGHFENPYDILELPHGTPFADVRIKYYKIARTHHPDKFIGTDEEKLRNEEYFKKVTVAYRDIELHGDAVGGDFFRGSGSGTSDWRSVWASVDSFFSRPEVWASMKTIITDHLKDVATKTFQKYHIVSVPLKLEDIHVEKLKKLRLFLNHITEPVFLNVNASNFPYSIKKHAILAENGQELEITLNFELRDHPLYTYDSIFGTDDLHARIVITLPEYILGKRCTIPYLDGTDIVVNILPFTDLTSSIFIPNKGLRKNKGNLYIFVEVTLPDKELWDIQSIGFKEKLLNSLNALSLKSAS